MYFKCYVFLKNYNTWPIDKPFLQQPIKFVKVVEYCDRVGAQLKESESEKNRIETELDSKKKKFSR